MPSQKTRRRPTAVEPPAFAEARDELFHHIMQCGVTDADEVHKKEWFDATMAYMAERYHELDATQITQLRTLGERFSQPPKRTTQGSGAA